MRDAVIVEAVRTPVAKGKPGGAYADIHPVDLHAHVLRAAVDRLGLDPAEVDDVIGGTVGQVGEQSTNNTRLAVLAAGFPESVPGTTVDRQCGSSQQALSFAAQGVAAGAYDIVIASGMESMSRVPIGSSALAGGTRAFVGGPAVAARYPGGLVPQGVSAELIARRWGLTRVQLDEFAATSHQRAAEAWKQGRFAEQIVPMAGLETDETIRPGTTVETLAGLRTAFADERWEQRFGAIDWKVTAGNSSPVNDGAAALVVTTSEIARQRGWRPRARVHTATAVGDDPILMLTGIIPATAKVLARAGLTLADIDAFEVNEAFSSVVLAWLAETGADPAKVNMDGGAIAIGHPLGASGARLATTLLGVLDRTGGRYGLQTMCEAGGTANATVIERLG
ncbi:thiolase family protein [Actinoplanes friuliensis]|uniref:Acetyl-CoA acyltransferase n=1 Tax=Actinoplanes friuliensis DSM 7358 TaxID=1246995 RepID=U5W2P0_9ACTN|nr:thiolase family protein [Actinoplanes friuliensis]AGZ42176.1 acetyl-CoA acyltransferase [Actinoplanes friuliensis DSM 7358]